MKWKILILNLLIFIPTKSNCQSIDYLGELDTNDTLRIEYIAGDESTEFNEIEIVNTAEKLFAKRRGKSLYVGTKTENNWVKPINKKNKNLINEFISKSTTQKKGGFWSSWREEYIITLNEDTITNLIGNHEWGIEKYYSFEEELFKEEYDELFNKRKNLDKKISTKLKGEWIILGNLADIKRGERIKLKRKTKEDEKCIWVFGNKKKFKSRCSKIDLKYSKEYRLDLDEGAIYLDIESGYKERILKLSELKNYGATFKIHKIEDELIHLEFMWR